MKTIFWSPRRKRSWSIRRRVNRRDYFKYSGVVVLAVLIFCFLNFYFARIIIEIILFVFRLFKKKFDRKKKWLWCISLCAVLGLEALGFSHFEKHIQRGRYRTESTFLEHVRYDECLEVERMLRMTPELINEIGADVQAKDNDGQLM